LQVKEEKSCYLNATIRRTRRGLTIINRQLAVSRVVDGSGKPLRGGCRGIVASPPGAGIFTCSCCDATGVLTSDCSSRPSCASTKGLSLRPLQSVLLLVHHRLGLRQMVRGLEQERQVVEG